MTNDLPSRNINTDNWKTVKEKQLADPDINKPAQNDLIIGAGQYEDLMVGNNRLKEANILVTYRLSVFDSSTTTKLRVVFDGSAMNTSGICLNDRLMMGPNIQKDLFSILILFRMYPVALSADISKMYRQVQLDAEDKDYHRLLWKEPNSTYIKTFRMTRVTYGIASSPFHSIRPLQA
ncbi:uncharacterized protein LOC142349720 [Convolutriloba macropyga]|uniref:uncharacterized protein LOC142349720 n=1 Tax=Convolutriloba macropyga TaxID=536237 RepID=UPI003F5202A1